MIESGTNWLYLPDRIWESILCNLNKRSLLNASESCKKINDLLSLSQLLIKKLSLQINIPHSINYTKNERAREKIYLRSFRNLEMMKECLKMSGRKYNSIIIRNLKDVKNPIAKYNYNAIFDILKQFAGSVKQIKFVYTSLQDEIFIKIMQTLKNLKVLKFERFCWIENNEAVTEIVKPDIVPLIHEIYFKEVDNIFFQKLLWFDNIIILDVEHFHWIYIWDFEKFLLLQKNLKVLNCMQLSFGVMFKSDKLAKVKFSLDELSLNSHWWVNMKNAMNFFKTQTNLKKVTLYLRYFWWFSNDDDLELEMCYNELLIHLFSNNLQLKTVFISISEEFGLDIKDYSFLEGIVNLSVENLTFNLDPFQNGIEFVNTFSNLFPNVKCVTHLVNEDYNRMG